MQDHGVWILADITTTVMGKSHAHVLCTLRREDAMESASPEKFMNHSWKFQVRFLCTRRAEDPKVGFEAMR